MQETFERSLEVGNDRASVWHLLNDVETLASCSKHIRDVRESAEGKAWTAVLQSGGGLFRVSAPIAIRVVDQMDDDHIAIEANGQDRVADTKLTVNAAITIRDGEAPDKLFVELVGSYEVIGTAATMGSTIVRSQAKSMVNEFWTKLEKVLQP